METDSQSYRKKNYSWAIFLVLLGILFLLNTTGYVGWGIWGYIIRFWPIFIVLIGFKILLGNSPLAKVLEIFLTIFLTVSVFLISYIQYTQKGFDLLPPQINHWVLQGGSGMFNLTQDSIEEQSTIAFDEYDTVIERDLTITMGAASFVLEEGLTDDYLHIDSKYPKSFREPALVKEYKEGVLNISFTGATSNTFHLFSNESKYTLSLGQLEVPTNIDIVLDAGDGGVVLEKLPVKDFFARVGAGKLNVQLGKDSIPSGDIHFNIGAGKMTLEIPERVGYAIDYDLGVGKININKKDISEFSSGRGTYKSTNYDISDIKMNLVITVGVGSFNLLSE